MKKKQLLVAVLSVIPISFGVGLSLKADIGVGAWDAIANSISILTNIKIGTVGIILNSSSILIQFLLLRKNFKIRHLLQLFIVIILGSFINFMFYTVLKNFTVTRYVFKVCLVLIGVAFSGFGVSSLLLTNTVGLPVEGVCEVIATKTNIKFHTLRQLVDVLSVITIFILTFMFKIHLTVREGTIIGMLLFGPSLGLFMKLLKPVFIKYDLINKQ